MLQKSNKTVVIKFCIICLTYCYNTRYWLIKKYGIDFAKEVPYHF